MSLEQSLPLWSEEVVGGPMPISQEQATNPAVAAQIARAGLEEDRIHAALEALPEETYAEAIEFRVSANALTAKLAGRCKRLITSPVLGAEGVDLRRQPLLPGMARPLSGGRERPARRFDLIVFTDIFSVANDAEADRYCDYALATLGAGGHVMLLNWSLGGLLDGDAAAEQFLYRVGSEMAPVLRRRMPHFRLDVLERA